MKIQKITLTWITLTELRVCSAGMGDRLLMFRVLGYAFNANYKLDAFGQHESFSLQFKSA